MNTYTIILPNTAVVTIQADSITRQAGEFLLWSRARNFATAPEGSMVIENAKEHKMEVGKK